MSSDIIRVERRVNQHRFAFSLCYKFCQILPLSQRLLPEIHDSGKYFKRTSLNPFYDIRDLIIFITTLNLLSGTAVYPKYLLWYLYSPWHTHLHIHFIFN